MASSTHLIVSERREEVLELLLMGKSHSYIVTYVTGKYKISPKSVHLDITKAYETIATDYAKDPAEIINKHMAMYYINVQKALDLGQVGAANQALQYIEKLKGMHKPDTQVNIQNNTLNLDNLTSEELLKILEKAEDKNNG